MNKIHLATVLFASLTIMLSACSGEPSVAGDYLAKKGYSGDKGADSDANPEDGASGDESNEGDEGSSGDSEGETGADEEEEEEEKPTGDKPTDMKPVDPVTPNPMTPTTPTPMTPTTPTPMTPTTPTPMTPTTPTPMEPKPAVITYAEVNTKILTKYCVACHGASSPKGGVGLESYAKVKAEIDAVKQQIESKKMPKNATLSAAEIKLISDWAAAGAPEK